MKIYTPKAIKGVPYSGYTKINRTQLFKLYSKNKDFLFSGFIVGNKVNPYHFFNGWYLACAIENVNEETMEKHLSSFSFYLEPELGSRVAIYLKNRDPETDWQKWWKNGLERCQDYTDQMALEDRLGFNL